MLSDGGGYWRVINCMATIPGEGQVNIIIICIGIPEGTKILRPYDLTNSVGQLMATGRKLFGFNLTSRRFKVCRIN